MNNLSGKCRSAMHSMVEFHDIGPVEGTVVPLPGELKKFCVPLLAPVCLSYPEGYILKQNWHDLSNTTYLIFVTLSLKQPFHIQVSPKVAPVTSLVYCQQGSFAVQEKQDGPFLQRPESSLFLRRVERHPDKFLVHFVRPGIYRILYCFLPDNRLALLQSQHPVLGTPELLFSRTVFSAGSLVRSIVVEMETRKFHSSTEQDMFLEEKVLRLYRILLEMAEAHSLNWRAMPARQRMLVLKEYINNHPGDNLSLSVLSSMLNMDRHALRKTFRKILRQNISGYVRSQRIKVACDILRTESSRNVGNVASKVGYDSIQGFYNAFQEMVGCTPRQYIVRLDSSSS